MRRFLPTFTSLLCFDASARHLSFTRAGEELHLTQSAVSRQVRNLEELVQCDLFHRIKKRLQLTEEGERYAKAVAEHLSGLERETLTLMTTVQDDNALNVGTFPTIGSRWLIPKLPEFTKRHPEIQLNLTTGVAPFDFIKNDVDVAIQHGTGDWPDVISRKLFDETVIAVCAPALVENSELVLPSDVLDHSLLSLQTRQYAWVEWLQTNNLDIKTGVNGPVFETFSMMIRATLSGLGVAIIPPMFIQEELRTGQLIAPFGPEIQSKRAYYLVTTEKKAGQNKINLFIDWLVTDQSV